MDCLYELCSGERFKDDSATSGSIGKMKQEKKRKRSSTKANIDMDSARGKGGGNGGRGGGSKKIPSPELYDVDIAERPRLSTARSTRSSPSAMNNDSSAADERPTKRSRMENNPIPRTGVLKVPPTDFPTEVGLLR